MSPVDEDLCPVTYRLNQKPAAITFQKKEKGGVNISRTVRMTHLDEDTIKAICKEYRVPCANVTFRCNATADQLIDTIEGNRVYMPCIYVLNKIGERAIQDAVCRREPEYRSDLPSGFGLPQFMCSLSLTVYVAVQMRSPLRSWIWCRKFRTTFQSQPIICGTWVSCWRGSGSTSA